MLREAEGARVISFADARRRRENRSEPWVKPDVVAEHFAVHRRTIYRWVKRGAPAQRLPGGAFRFQMGALQEWLDQVGPLGGATRRCVRCLFWKPASDFRSGDAQKNGRCSDCWDLA